MHTHAYIVNFIQLNDPASALAASAHFITAY